MGISTQDTLHRANAHGNYKGSQKYNPTFYTKRKRFEYPPPFPITPQPHTQRAWKKVPPKPEMTIQTSGNTVILNWDLKLTQKIAEIENYELFVCKETDTYPCISMWKKQTLGAVRLPMGCELEVFESGYTYYFAMRAVDVHKRCGPFVVVKTYV